jgi:hypothetical protein
MVATGADRSSEPASLHTGRRIPTIVRRVLARRKSLSAGLYLISAGLIATWVIGVFFGLGFFLLVDEPRRSVSVPAAIDQPVPSREGGHPVKDAIGRNPDLPEKSDQPVPQVRVKPPRSAGKEAPPVGDPAGMAPQNQNAIAVDRPEGVSTGPGREQTVVEPDKSAPPVDVGPTFGSLGKVASGPVPPGMLSGVTGGQGNAPTVHSHKRHRPPAARARQRHAPVRAIQDVLQKHSRLLK